MGVTSSKDAPYSEYSLFQDSLTIDAITVVRNSKRDQDQDDRTAGSSATRSTTWRMVQDETGELEFDVEEAEDGTDGTRSAQIEWVSDPSSSRKNPRTALLKLEIREHERLTFTFDVKALADPLADSTISIADSTSPAELEQLSLERKQSNVGFVMLVMRGGTADAPPIAAASPGTLGHRCYTERQTAMPILLDIPSLGTLDWVSSYISVNSQSDGLYNQREALLCNLGVPTSFRYLPHPSWLLILARCLA